MLRSLRLFASGLGLAVGLGLVVSPLIGSVTAAAPATMKIASIDLERTLTDTSAGKRANEEFDKTRKAKQAELDTKQKTLQKAASELDKQAAVLKPDVLAQKKGELEKQFVELQQVYVKLERALAEDRSKVIRGLFEKAGPVIKEIAQAEGIHMVIDRSAVVWGVPEADLTDKLIARMK
jgi:outer membrane protein